MDKLTLHIQFPIRFYRINFLFSEYKFIIILNITFIYTQ